MDVCINKYTEDHAETSYFTGSFLDVIKDPDAKFNWIRPVSFRGSGVAFKVDMVGQIACVWPACMMNLTVGFSIKEFAEDWELIDPQHVMIEVAPTLSEDEYKAWLKETRMDG